MVGVYVDAAAWYCSSHSDSHSIPARVSLCYVDIALAIALPPLAERPPTAAELGVGTWWDGDVAHLESRLIDDE